MNLTFTEDIVKNTKKLLDHLNLLSQSIGGASEASGGTAQASNNLVGDYGVITPGANVRLDAVGGNLKISATGGGGGGLTHPQIASRESLRI